MATVRMPSSRQALITRKAISPRLATRTLRSIGTLKSGVSRTSKKKPNGVNEDCYTRDPAPLTPLAPLAPLSHGSNGKQRLAVFDGLSIGYEASDDLAPGIGLDLVHQFHRFDNADHLALFHMISGANKRRGTRR